MKLPRFFRFGLTLFFLSGCFESEESCFKKLRDELDKDIKSYSDLATNPPSDSTYTALDFSNFAVSAARMNLHLYLMYSNENIDVCDYFLFGSKLMKKD